MDLNRQRKAKTPKAKTKAKTPKAKTLKTKSKPKTKTPKAKTKKSKKSKTKAKPLSIDFSTPLPQAILGPCGPKTIEAAGPHSFSLVYDEQLKRKVLHILVKPLDFDGSKGIYTGRQRSEWKGSNLSPPGPLRALANQTISYRLVFSMGPSMENLDDFYHLFQLKPEGKGICNFPSFYLTLEGPWLVFGSRLDLIPSMIMGRLKNLKTKWLSLSLEVFYHRSDGWLKVSLADYQSKETLAVHSFEGLKTWQEGYAFVRPKMGIYRSCCPAYKQDHWVRHGYFEAFQ